MKLIRFALIYLFPPPKSLESKNFNHNIVQISYKIICTSDQQQLKVLVSAIVKIAEEIELTDQNTIIVPEKPRKISEESIEYLANLLSVAKQCKRIIKSPIPCLGFVPENIKEINWLNSTKGIHSNKPGIIGTNLNFRLNKSFMKALDDRKDGVSLLAEVLANDHSTGKYHELIRFFERAFRLSSNSMGAKLTQFLKGANLGYNSDEIHKWVEYRDPATHGDKKKTRETILESDVRVIIPRMVQASYDVLLNKKKWHDPSKERRSFWINNTESSNSKIYLATGTNPSLKFIWFDDFDSYPVDKNLNFDYDKETIWSEWAT